MPKVERIDENSHVPPSTATVEIGTPPEPETISFSLAAGGEAVFNLPTVRNLKAVERENLSPTDICRRLGEITLVSWGDASVMPPDDEIDAEDDITLIETFSDLLRTVNDVDTSEQKYEVQPDKSHLVVLSDGRELVLRRLTRVDMRQAEASTAKGTESNCRIAVSACKSWWRSDRKPMPADFDNLGLEDWSRISQALLGFFRRRTTR